MIDWICEKSLIRVACRARAIDPAFLMAIRETENGGSGIEFGVEPPGQYDYFGQLKIAVATVAHRLEAFPGNPLIRNASGQIVYSDKFIDYFAAIWAPLKVANDPHDLNANWPGNCKKFYPLHYAQEVSLKP
jgi:hypothetical protein